MNYVERDAISKASREKLPAVIAAGESLGYWKQCAPTVAPAADDTWRFCDVETPDGLRFSFYAGSWAVEGKITVSIACLRDSMGVAVVPRDVSGSNIEAAATHTRAAEVIAKDLFKRAVSNPEAVKTARAMCAMVANNNAMRASLNGHIKTLISMGYEFRNIGVGNYKADGYSQKVKPKNITVFNDGRIDFEVSTSIANFATIQKVL